MKYTWSIREVYLHYTWSNLKYIWSMLQVYLKYTSEVQLKYLKYTYSILTESTLYVYLKYTTWSILLQVYIKSNGLISQNVLQIYFFCRDNIDLKNTSSSEIAHVEVNLKYTWGNLKHIWSMLQVYLNYTSNVF